MHLLYCDNPLTPGTPDFGFEQEHEAALASGHTLHFFPWDLLVREGNATRALRRLPQVPDGTALLYRGWMLRPAQYALLFDALRAKGYWPLNDPEAYRLCHHLPEHYPLLEGHTPRSRWLPCPDGQPDWDQVLALAASFGDVPLVLKDYVKSEKHHWEEACFIPSAEDDEKVRSVATRFLELRGDALNDGIVFREFVPLRQIGTHPQSGLPLMLEYRMFFLNGHHIACIPYWDEGDYNDLPMPPIVEMAALAGRLRSHFFSMDVAMTAKGDWIVMEVGDGQVSGFPERTELREFWGNC